MEITTQDRLPSEAGLYKAAAHLASDAPQLVAVALDVVLWQATVPGETQLERHCAAAALHAM